MIYKLKILFCAGKIRLLQSGESDVSKSLDELSKSSLHLKRFMFLMDMYRTYGLLLVLMYD